LARAPSDVDLYFNSNPEFTRWVIDSDALHEPFVVIDVGVLGGENPRWHFLRKRLVVHGFDAVKEAIEELRLTNWDLNWDRSYHWTLTGGAGFNNLLKSGVAGFAGRFQSAKGDPQELANSERSQGAMR
jgi:hypothetical protein